VEVEEISDQPLYDPNALIDKTGATEGFRTYVAVIPGKMAGIAIMANKYISNGAIVNAGREILFKVAKITENNN
jgi:beta-lactamase class C